MEHLRSLAPALPGFEGWSEQDGTRALVFIGSVALALVSTLAILYLPFIFSLALPVALIATMIVLRYPVFSLIGIFFGRITIDLMWFVPAGLGLNFMEAFTGGITVLLILMCMQRIQGVLDHPFFPFVTLWVALLLVGAAQQPEARVVAELLARFGSPMMIMLLFSIHFRTHESRRKLFIWVGLGGILPIVLGLFYWATGQAANMQLSGYDRLAGGYSNIADHGQSMATFAMIGLMWIWHHKASWKSAAILGYTCLAVLLLLLTYARTPLIGFAAFVFVFLALHRNRSLLLVAGAVLVLILATNSTAQDRFSDFTDFFTVDAGYQVDRLGSGRLGIWRRSFEAFFSQPFLQILLGNGLNSQYLLSDGQDSHNDYISLMLQVGPIGLALWAGFQIDATRRAYQELAYAYAPWTRTLLIMILGLSACVVVSNTFSNVYVSRVTPSWYWFGMMGVVFAIQAERRAREPEGAVAA